MEHCTINRKHHTYYVGNNDMSKNLQTLVGYLQKMKGVVHKVRQHFLRGRGSKMEEKVMMHTDFIWIRMAKDQA